MAFDGGRRVDHAPLALRRTARRLVVVVVGMGERIAGTVAVIADIVVVVAAPQ